VVFFLLPFCDSACQVHKKSFFFFKLLVKFLSSEVQSSPLLFLETYNTSGTQPKLAWQRQGCAVSLAHPAVRVLQKATRAPLLPLQGACVQAAAAAAVAIAVGAAVGDQLRRVGDPDRRVGDQLRRVGDPDRRVGDQLRRVGDPDRRVGDQLRRVGDRLRRLPRGVVLAPAAAVQANESKEKTNNPTLHTRPEEVLWRMHLSDPKQVQLRMQVAAIMLLISQVLLRPTAQQQR